MGFFIFLNFDLFLKIFTKNVEISHSTPGSDKKQVIFLILDRIEILKNEKTPPRKKNYLYWIKPEGYPYVA